MLLVLSVLGERNTYRQEWLPLISLVSKCRSITTSVLVPPVPIPSSEEEEKRFISRWFSGGSQFLKRKEWLMNSVEFVCGRTCLTCYPGCLSRRLCRQIEKKHTHTHTHTHTRGSTNQIAFGSHCWDFVAASGSISWLFRAWSHSMQLNCRPFHFPLNTHLTFVLLPVILDPSEEVTIINRWKPFCFIKFICCGES